MKVRRLIRIMIIPAIFFFAVSTRVMAGDLSYQRWGLRGGFSFDIDQVLVGAQVDFGTLMEDKVRFEPNVELGFGNDFLTLGLAGDFKYVFEGDDFLPFLTSGLQLTFSEDNEAGDRSGTDLSLNLGGGLYFPIGYKDCFVDTRFGLGAVHDLRIVVGLFFD